MKGFLLDTNVLSEARKGKRCDERVARWLARHAEDPQYTSSICIMEIRYGIELLRRKQARSAEQLDDWFESKLKPVFNERILSVDMKVAEACGRLHAKRPRSFRDALIGATALCHQLAMVTRNSKDFADMDVTIINPWQG
jgi:predicted nucleic acid-binding protein